MSYGEQHKDLEPGPPFNKPPIHWWKRRKLCHTTTTEDRPAPTMALLNLPPTLDCTSSNRTSCDVEKALSGRIATTSPNLPPKRYTRTLRHLRLTVFTVYRRIFTLVFIANMIGLFLTLRSWRTQTITLDSLATWASTNLLISILVRQDFFVNPMFRTAWLVPWSVPLRLRRVVARVYTYGGIHSGTAVAGTMWFFTFTTLMTIHFARQGSYTVPLVVLTWLILVLLTSIILLALPGLRAAYHNTFEMTHRFLGWVSIALFWAQVLLLTYHTSKASPTSASFGEMLVHSPTFWNLVLITCLVILPWLRVRRWTFTPEVLSSHALHLHFTHSIHRFSCLIISTSPLKEWHPFATFPTRDSGEPGGSMVISAAGDWTTSLIQSQIQAQAHRQPLGYISNLKATPPTPLRMWTRGTVKAGVLSLSILFPRVVILTTGSGIGPALSSLLDKPPSQFCRLIWSTRSPLLTYGARLCAEVERADPGAIIIDTSRMGRPDLLQVAWNVYKETGAEAVFVLSNESVTRKVVYGLESRGVPAYGPIWDS